MTEPTKSITADDAKQSGNGVKGKEAEVGKERRPGSQARKVCKKLIDKTTAKALRNSLKCIDTSILVNEIEAGSNCNVHDLKSALLLLSKLVNSRNNQSEDVPDCSRLCSANSIPFQMLGPL